MSEPSDSAVANAPEPPSEPVDANAVHPDSTHPDSTSYDIPLPEHLKAAFKADWNPAPPMPHPASPDVAVHAARRRSALSAQFPGKLIVVPAGNPKVRANDTDYVFRADSAFTWLTGETACDAVLVMTPDGSGHSCTLYLGEFAQAGEPGYFASRMHGALWVGNVPSLRDTTEALGIRTLPLKSLADELRARHADQTVALRGIDASVDALVAGAE